MKPTQANSSTAKVKSSMFFCATLMEFFDRTMPGFQQHEADLHHEHKAGRDQHPHHIKVGFGGGNGGAVGLDTDQVKRAGFLGVGRHLPSRPTPAPPAPIVSFS
jgi:hypothetical protein